jgi:hypothetical protein
MSKQLSVFRGLADLCEDGYWKELFEQCAKHQFPARVRLTKGCLERQVSNKKRVLLPLPKIASFSELERCKEFFAPLSHESTASEASEAEVATRPPLLKEFDQGHLRNYYLYAYAYYWYEQHHDCILTPAQKDQLLDTLAVGWSFGIIDKHHLVIDDQDRLVDISNIRRDPEGWFYVDDAPSKRSSRAPRQSSVRCSVYRVSVA